MRVKFILVFVILFVCSCVPKEQVVLRAINNLTVEQGTGTDPLLKAEAVFYNPNNMRMKLKEINMDVFLDGKKSAHSEQKFNSLIKEESEFTVPLEVQLSLKEIGLLDTILGFFGGRKYEVRYAGYIRVSVNGISIKVPVDETEEVKFRN